MKPAKTKGPTELHRNHDEAAIESFRRDAKFTAYLSAVLDDGDRAKIMTALRYLTEAFGGVPAIAIKANLNTTTH